MRAEKDVEKKLSKRLKRSQAKSDPVKESAPR